MLVWSSVDVLQAGHQISSRQVSFVAWSSSSLGDDAYFMPLDGPFFIVHLILVEFRVRTTTKTTGSVSRVP